MAVDRGELMINDLIAIDQKKIWNKVLNYEISSDMIVLQFIIGNLDLNYLANNYQYDEQEKCVITLVNALLSTPISRIRLLLTSEPLENKVSAANIPQFSNFATAVIYLPELLLTTRTYLTYREMGYMLFSETKSDGAAEKYGQNHGSLAVQLGLASITKCEHKKVFCQTPLTYQYCQLEYAKKMELLQRLCFRIPIIQIAATSEKPNIAVDECLKNNLAKTTCIRRRSNVLEVLAFALGE